MERCKIIHQVTSKYLFKLNDTNPHTATFGTEADISKICQCVWYEYVYYRGQSASYPHMKEFIGRCLGPTQNEVNKMAQWILTGNGQVVPRRATRHLTKSELAPTNDTEQRKRTEFDVPITNRIGNAFTLPPTIDPDIVHAQGNEANPQGGDFDPYLDDDEIPEFVPQPNILNAAGKPILQKSFYDTMVNVELLLPRGQMNWIATIVKQSVDNNLKAIGSWNDNPMLNTLVYECEFSDGTVKEYSANIIAENIFLEADADGHRDIMMTDITNHK